MQGHNRIPYEDVKRLSQAKALLEYSEREQKEMLNHLEAFEFVKKEAKAGVPFTEEKLKDIHEILVEGIFQGGVYRNVNISIFGASHQPPDHVKVYDRMSKFFRNIEHFQGDVLEKATYAHASIAKIHPFVDANGRLAKLVLNYFLMMSDYLPISIPLEMREEYIARLELFKSEKDLKFIQKNGFCINCTVDREHDLRTAGVFEEYQNYKVWTRMIVFGKTKLEELKHENLQISKLKLLEARKQYINFYKENPDALVKNAVFGFLEKYDWQLLERKHLNHHFKQFGLL